MNSNNKIVIILTSAFVILATMTSSLVVKAQTEMRLDDTFCCSNSESLLPVTILNFDNIATFTIYIGVENTNNIESVSFENLNSELSSGNFVGNYDIENKVITFNWASLTAMTVDSSKLCDIRLTFKGESEELVFLENCEIADASLNIIDDVLYVDGSITAFNSLTPEPVTQSVYENNNAIINIASLNNQVSCKWQLKTDDQWSDLSDNNLYSGVNTVNLSITGVQTSMDGNIYRGLLSNGICEEGTNTSELLVVTSNTQDNQSINVEDYLNIYPNPVTDLLNCEFNIDLKDVRLVMFNSTGNAVCEYNLGRVLSGQNKVIDIDFLSSGAYFLKLFSANQLLSDFKVIIQ